MSNSEQRRQLAESLREAVEGIGPDAASRRQQAETVRVEVSARRKRNQLIALVLTWGALGWIWIAQPGFIFDPPLDVGAPSPQSAEAGLRYGMYLQGARIREFEASHGRLPTTITEARVAEEGLTYSVDGSQWTLRGEVDGLRLELTSAMAPDSFRVARVNSDGP